MKHLSSYSFSQVPYSKIKTLSALVVSLCAGSVMFTGCSQQTTTENTPNPAQNTEQTAEAVYTVITQPDFHPFVFRDADSSLTGFDIDVVNAIAKKANINVRFITMPREQLFDAIQSNEYDMLASSVTITEDRAQLMQFSDPYFVSKQSVLLNQHVPAISNFEELQNYKIAVKKGTTSDTLLMAIMGEKTDNIVYTETAYLGVTDTLAGKVDGIVSDSGVVDYYGVVHKKDGVHTFSDPNYPTENYGFAFAKGRSDDLINKINTGLSAIKGDGTYQAINDKWFGQTE